MKLAAFTESVKPDKRTDDEHNHGVRNEDPIEKNETEGNMIPLNDRSNG